MCRKWTKTQPVPWLRLARVELPMGQWGAGTGSLPTRASLALVRHVGKRSWLSRAGKVAAAGLRGQPKHLGLNLPSKASDPSWLGCVFNTWLE